MVVLSLACRASLGGDPGGDPPPPTPPAAPTGLTATPADAQVTLAWNASTGATGYHVWQRAGSGSFTEVQQQAGTGWISTGLTNGTQYSFYVTASNAAGASAASATVSATPQASATPPAAPTGLAATAGNAQVALSWNASTGATGYHVWQRAGSGSFTEVHQQAGTGWTSTGLTNGTQYSFYVTASNAAGTSAASATVSATPQAPPPPATSCTSPAPGGGGTAYHVGTDQQYTSIGAVPWYALQAGDTVYIHYRSTPYHEKFLVSGRGTPTQWIRVLGVPGPGGEKPVISGDGATTSTNMHHHWQDASGGSAIQWDGVVQIAVNNGDPAPLPGYIEIAGLQVQDGYKSYQFTAENGTTSSYDGFAACIYARSAQHLLIRDNVMTNCGQGFYDWTGDGSSDTWWAGLSQDIVLSGNTFSNNGNPSSWTEHQTYTESNGVLIECNHYGAQRAGAWGSQLKDRSAGTVVRYNTMEQSHDGWDLDLVESEEGWHTLGSLPSYKQAFVYGNLIVNRGVYDPNLVHWNEDHNVGGGRATLDGGRLFFYDNTVVTVANQADMASFNVFNVTWGGYDCPPGSLAGIIDVRNNIFANIPRTAGSPVPAMQFGYCGQENLAFGSNWVSPGWTAHGATVTGAGSIVSPANDDPGFVNAAAGDFHLTAASSAAGIGGALAPEVTSNSLGLNLTPSLQLTNDGGTTARAASGAGSDAGAFGR